MTKKTPRYGWHEDQPYSKHGVFGKNPTTANWSLEITCQHSELSRLSIFLSPFPFIPDLIRKNPKPTPTPNVKTRHKAMKHNSIAKYVHNHAVVRNKVKISEPRCRVVDYQPRP